MKAVSYKKHKALLPVESTNGFKMKCKQIGYEESRLKV